MDFSLNVKQELKLVLIQEMKTSLNILEMSTFELEKFILKEVKSNPILEVDFSSGKNYSSSSESEVSPLDFAYEEENLIDFLEEQIGFLKLSNETKFLCIFIINNLDSKGYLPIDKKEIKNLTKYPMKEIEEALKIVKNLDPIGIASSSLEDCLIFQLHKKNINDIKLEYLINNLLGELAEGRINLIADKLGITTDIVNTYFSEIRKLNPIPSRGFYMGDNIRYIAPDAEIKKENDIYVVTMIDDNLPKIKINKEKAEKTKDNQNYINSASMLLKCIEKRHATLKRILDAILEKQYNYFSLKSDTKKTLSMKEISIQLKMHESTVSRAIKNKYISTEHGLERIRDIFVLNDKKEEVEKIIQELVVKEDRKKPITDQEISDFIEEKGIKIARRTVAKYREDLGIKSTSKRRIR